MPNTREKLIELICSTEYGNGSLMGNNFQKGFIEKIADHLIANGVTVNEWISVKDRLPEESGDYLALTDGGFIERLSYSERHNAFNADDRLMNAECAIPCTHWMPLPSVEGLK